MKFLNKIILVAIVTCSCNEQPKDHAKNKSSKIVVPIVKDNVQSPQPVVDDSLLISTTRQVLQALKNKDFKKFAAYIHPTSGARFSPYGFIDTTSDKVFSQQQFMLALAERKKITWGYFDGSGDSIKLNVEEYFMKFVYNADFLNAKQTAINKMIGSGNSLNNLPTIYKDAPFTESYFPGFNPKYNGMDWCALRLVYHDYKGKYFLIAVVHDQWTI